MWKITKGHFTLSTRIEKTKPKANLPSPQNVYEIRYAPMTGTDRDNPVFMVD